MSHKRSQGQRVGNIAYGCRLANDGVHVEADPDEQAVLSEIRQLRTRLAPTSRMMFTRVAPLRLKFSLMGSRTLVARTISALMPFKALPNSVSLSPRL